jgi:hypothetical protein
MGGLMSLDQERFALLKYWRNSLADNDKLAVTYEHVQYGIGVDNSVFAAGKLPTKEGASSYVTAFINQTSYDLAQRRTYQMTTSTAVGINTTVS